MKNIIDNGFVSMLEGHTLRVANPMDGLFGGNRRSTKYGSSVDFADYREYQPGDDLRRIDWNLYARFDKLYLKLFTDERQQHHRIYIDASASMGYGEPAKSECALKLAAALAYLSVSAMDRVSIYVIHETEIEKLGQTIHGREGFYQLVQLLNQVEFYGDAQMGKAFLMEENLGHFDGMSILISDFLTDENFLRGIDRMVFEKRQVEMIQIFSREEVAPGMSGQYLLLDSEGVGEEDPKNFRVEVTRKRIEAYQLALRFIMNRLRNYANSRGIGYIWTVSDESIEKMLFIHAAKEGLIQ